MFGRISKLFHKEARRRFAGKHSIAIDKSKWPHNWKQVEFKEYPRMEQIMLPEPGDNLNDLKEVLECRSSSRNEGAHATVNTNDLSTLLHYAAGIKNRSDSKEAWDRTRRRYPSGGALYPLEVYVAVSSVKDVPPGVYHYNLKLHTLERIIGSHNVAQVYETIAYDWAARSNFNIIISAVWDRTFQKYHDFGYRSILIEAGHLSQNFLLVGTAVGMGACPVLGFDNEKLDEMLDIVHEGEASLIMITFGRSLKN